MDACLFRSGHGIAQGWASAATDGSESWLGLNSWCPGLRLSGRTVEGHGMRIRGRVVGVVVHHDDMSREGSVKSAIDWCARFRGPCLEIKFRLSDQYQCQGLSNASSGGSTAGEVHDRNAAHK
jgi:hypothetical protein